MLFLALRGIADDDFQKETVDLRLRQRIGSFLLYGVLCGHDEEWLFQLEGSFAYGNLAFLHRLEKSALNLGGSAVDFVGEDEVGKQRATLDLEALGLYRIYHCADKVGRKQVGRELYSAVFGVDELREGLDRQCLCQTGHTLKEHMSVAQ